MRYTTIAFFSMCVAAVGILCGCAAELPPPLLGQARNETAASLKHCPDGHATLKDVPIIYGLPPQEGPEAKRWTLSVRNLEFWPGGCVSSPSYPKVRPTCTRCGFGYDSTFGQWDRESEDIKTFKRPFSSLVKSFPKPTGTFQKVAVKYRQSVRSNRVNSQGLSFNSSEPREAIVEHINAWIKANDITATYKEEEITTSRGTQKVICNWDGGKASVRLHHTKADGESWIMLFVSNS